MKMVAVAGETDTVGLANTSNASLSEATGLSSTSATHDTMPGSKQQCDCA